MTTRSDTQHGDQEQHDDHSAMTRKMYLRFGAMILTSMVVMYAVMFVGTWRWDHVMFSQSRVFMALTMGGAMGLVMIAWMADIIAAQKREIREMQWLLEDIEENGKATTAAAAEERQVPEFEVSDLRDCAGS